MCSTAALLSKELGCSFPGGFRVLLAGAHHQILHLPFPHLVASVTRRLAPQNPPACALVEWTQLPLSQDIKHLSTFCL